jgi:E3 ubiquitin-protein ligase BIG BROTHER-like protein
MDGSSKGIGGGASADKPTTDHQDQNASPNVPAGAGASAAAAEGRRPFTSLSQEEADLALARVLQEQVSSRDLGISRVG